MKKLIRKGVNIHHLKNGTARYYPFAVYNESDQDGNFDRFTETTYHVTRKRDWRLANHYTLDSLDTTWFAKEEDALDALQKAIQRYEVFLKEMEENQVVKKETKYL